MIYSGDNVVLSSEASGIPNLHQSGRTHLLFLDGLRGLAALYVVLHHFLLWGTQGLPAWADKIFGWTRFGHFAVDVFITLSGFCLMIPVARSPDRPLQGGFWAFVGRRARRILPSYWAALCLGLALAWFSLGVWGQPKLTLGDILSHAFLVHDLRQSWSHTIDMAMWSIAPEWQIYFVFALILLPIWRRLGSIATIVVGFIIGLIPHFTLKMGHNYDWACPWYIGLFALGMAGAVTVFSPHPRRLWPAMRFLWLSLLLLMPYAAMKAFHASQTGDDMDALEWLKDALGGGIVLCFILYCALS